MTTRARASAPADALLTDLYQLSMLQAYWEHGLTESATFDLFCRRLPPHRNLLIACGLEAALDYLENVAVTAADLEFLASLNRFSTDFLDRLERLRFGGEVRAVPEGTPVFGNEPDPGGNGLAARGADRGDVSAQRDPSPDHGRVRRLPPGGCRQGHAGCRLRHAARARRGSRRGYRPSGLHRGHGGYLERGGWASVWRAAERHHGAQLHPGARARVGRAGFVRGHAPRDHVAGGYLRRPRRRAEGDRPGGASGDSFDVAAIRIDSGDLGANARMARAMLDAAGLTSVRITVSGELDAESIANLVAAGAPIDGFGVGTALAVSTDAPYLDTAYKLAAYAGQGRMKLAASKRTWPGRKQVFRRVENGVAVCDVLGTADEELEGYPILQPVMAGGRRLDGAQPTLDAIREHAERSLAELPDRLRSLMPAEPPYPVAISDGLRKAADALARRLEAGD